jgi:cellulose synthase/poly-beta-1,6-N-acetylglucosamine synthase-like glycosyltransferase
VPLGGTTLFFRRAALEGMGGWDAHNVTEDADLGIRLARRGFRTELIDTVTKEEANCRPWPWIKQRSRWIKGYAMTYGVHMRAPRRLLAELGWRKTIGVQVLFLGTLSQFVLAPFLWSFWVTALGFSHPVVDRMPGWMGLTMAGAFFSAEIVNIAIGISALGAPEHRFLRKWVPTLHFYYPLATLAAVKAIAEIVTRPFYWDKTHHGAYHTVPDILTPAPIAPPNQA